MVKTTATIEDVVDSENRVNNQEGLDTCILAEVITHSFDISSPRFKSRGFIGTPNLDAFYFYSRRLTFASFQFFPQRLT